MGHDFASLNKYGNNGVDSVSCPSATFCMAGDDTVSTKGDLNYLDFVLIWNGRSWRDQELATALNTGENGEINSVLCTSGSFCAVAGHYAQSGQPGDQGSFVATWNGKDWSYRIEDGSNDAVEGGIFTLSCASAGSCVGGGADPLGSFDSEGLVSFWNGARWHNVVVKPVGPQPARESGPSANAGVQGEFDSISCPSADFCAADDFYVESVGELGYTQGRSLLWTWNRS